MNKNNLIQNTKILRQINLWTWLASILPLAALAGLWFSWSFGSHSLLNIIMIVGGTTMFTAAVVWWWWALKVMKTLLSHWDRAALGIEDISGSVKEIRSIVREVIPSPSDK
jgi:hypothetical protein